MFGIRLIINAGTKLFTPNDPIFLDFNLLPFLSIFLKWLQKQVKYGNTALWEHPVCTLLAQHLELAKFGPLYASMCSRQMN